MFLHLARTNLDVCSYVSLREVTLFAIKLSVYFQCQINRMSAAIWAGVQYFGTYRIGKQGWLSTRCLALAFVSHIHKV